MVGKLKDNQEMAVDNYCLRVITNKEKGYTWTQAMRDAGFTDSNIDKNGHKLKENPLVVKRIEKTKAGLRRRLELKAEDVLYELKGIGFSNIEDFINVDKEGDVSIKGFGGIDRHKLAAVESIKVNTVKGRDNTKEYSTTQFKLHSKLSALDALCKHLGLYEMDNSQKGTKLLIALRNEQQAIDRQLETLKALDDVPDALVL